MHTHLAEAPLTPGVDVPPGIQIWPSSTLFRQEERLRVVSQGSDIFRYLHRAPGLPLAMHQETRNRGRHPLLTGGRYDAHRPVPLIPG